MVEEPNHFFCIQCQNIRLNLNESTTIFSFDGQNGSCALGVLMSYYGWDGKDESKTYKILMSAFNAIKSAGIDRNLLIEMNDSGFSFDEIADYLDRYSGR